MALAVALGAFRDAGTDGAPAGVVQVGGRGANDLVRAASTPVLAADPTNPRRLLLANRIERPRFSCSVFASGDGGATWKRSSFPLPPTGERCYAPTVAFRPDGRALLLLTTLKGRGNEAFGVYLLSSTDGGATFDAPRPVLPPFTFQTSLAVGSDGALYVSALSGSVFSRHTTFGLGTPPNPVMLSAARGARFGGSRNVSGPGRSLVGGPALALGPHSEIYVLYWDYGDDVFDYYAFPGRYGGRFRLMIAASRDGGRTFVRHVVDPAVVPLHSFLVYLPPLPALAVDPGTGAVFAAWADGRSGAGDVLLRSSPDGGSTWTPARALFASAAEERVPALMATRRRLVALAYRIARGGRTEVAVRVSRDGGGTFGPAAGLTPSPFDSTIVPRLANHPDLPDLGSRLGLLPDASLAAWADARGGTADTGKVDILAAPIPDGSGQASPLPAAARPRSAVRSRTDRRLTGGCAHGPEVASRASSFAVVRSFVSALDRGRLRRAYALLDPRWRAGAPPLREPHPFRELARAYASVTCLRLASGESYDRSEDGRWKTIRVWLAVERGGHTRLGIGIFWTHSATARAPWSIIGYWTREP